MQSVLFRIWTRVAVSISYDDNHYTTVTSGLLTVIENMQIFDDRIVIPPELRIEMHNRIHERHLRIVKSRTLFFILNLLASHLVWHRGAHKGLHNVGEVPTHTKGTFPFPNALGQDLASICWNSTVEYIPWFWTTILSTGQEIPSV